jgi:hypothetical protein
VPTAAAEGRRRLLGTIAEAIEQLGFALAALTEAYERLDEAAADRLEDDLFRPVQGAYARARRAYGEFAARNAMAGRTFVLPAAGAPVHGVRGLVERAVEAVQGADATLADLQDSLAPVEFGDRELREGLADVRVTIERSQIAARELLRTYGR